MSPRTTIESWARILWLSKYSKENLIALLCAAYFDASGRKDYPVMSVGGAIAPVYKWVRFEQEWCAALKEEGVSEFHATDFAAGKGAFKNWDKPRRGRFLKTLGVILNTRVNKFFCASIESEAWESVNKEYLLQECFHSQYALCGFAVVKQILQWEKRHRSREVKIFFEKGDPGWGGVERLCEGIGVNPIPLPKKEAVPFQASDLIAWKSRIAFTNGLKKFNQFMAMQEPTILEIEGMIAEEESLKKIMVKPGTPGVFSRSALLDNCVKFKIPRRPLGKE